MCYQKRWLCKIKINALDLVSRFLSKFKCFFHFFANFLYRFVIRNGYFAQTAPSRSHYTAPSF